MEPYNLEKVNPKIRPNAYFPIKEGIKWRVENFRPYITIIIFAFKKLGLFLSLASLLLMFLDLPLFSNVSKLRIEWFPLQTKVDVGNTIYE